MAKITKVFGAIFCVLGAIYFTVSVFLYMNTSAFLNYNEAKRQVVAIDEVELRKKASEAWEVENKYHPNGINPTAFEFGYKVGYKAALKNK